MGGTGGHRDRETQAQPCWPPVVCVTGGFHVLSCVGGNPYLSRGLMGGPLTTPDKQMHGRRQTSKEARWALYWRTCHRHTDTAGHGTPSPAWKQPRAWKSWHRPGYLPVGGQRDLLGINHPPAPSLLPGLPRDPWEKSQPWVGVQGLRGLKGDSQAPLGCGPPSRSPFSSSRLGCDPQVTATGAETWR